MPCAFDLKAFHRVRFTDFRTCVKVFSVSFNVVNQVVLAVGC